MSVVTTYFLIACMLWIYFILFYFYVVFLLNMEVYCTVQWRTRLWKMEDKYPVFPIRVFSGPLAATLRQKSGVFGDGCRLSSTGWYTGMLSGANSTKGWRDRSHKGPFCVCISKIRELGPKLVCGAKGLSKLCIYCIIVEYFERWRTRKKSKDVLHTVQYSRYMKWFWERMAEKREAEPIQGWSEYQGSLVCFERIELWALSPKIAMRTKKKPPFLEYFFEDGIFVTSVLVCITRWRWVNHVVEDGTSAGAFMVKFI